MADPLSPWVQVGSLVGGVLGGVLAVGMGIEKIRGWLAAPRSTPPQEPAPAATRETVYLPAAPRGTLADADLDALRGRVSALELARAADVREREQKTTEAAEKAAAGALNRLVERAATAKKKPKATTKESDDADRPSDDPPTDP